MADDLMNTKDVLAYLKISRSTLYRLIREGKLQPVRLAPRTMRFRKEDVDALLERSM